MTDTVEGGVQYGVGTRWRSVACATEVIVVKAGLDADAGALACGGWPMASIDAEPGDAHDVREPHDSGTLLGKRYTNADGAFEVLCTKGGAGSLSIGEDALVIKGTKSLPSSD